jgi:hypothetical protein
LTLSVGPDNSLAINFVPTEAGPHKVGIKKFGDHVKSSPFVIMVGEAGPTGPTVGHDVHTNLDIPDIKLPDDLKDLTGELERPTGKKEPLNLSEGPGHTLSLNFIPNEPGKHLIYVKKKGTLCQGSPYTVIVEMGDGEAAPSLSEKSCGLVIPGIKLPQDFKDLKATLESPSKKKEPIELQLGPDNKTILISFLPTEVGVYKVHITRLKRPVQGSPFEFTITQADVDASSPKATGDKPGVGDQTSINFSASDITLPRDLSALKAKVTRPNGKQDTITCKTNPDNTLGLEFIPAEVGKHLIEITKRGKPVKGSPLVVDVDDQPLKKKTISESPVEEAPEKTICEEPVESAPADAPAKKPAEDVVDGKKAPGRVPVGEDEVSPEQIGHDHEMPDKALPEEVVEEPIGPCVGHPVEANLEIEGVNLPRDLRYLEGELERPNGLKAFLPVAEGPDKTIALNFTPEEAGPHLVHLSKRGTPCNGSPFTIDVDEAPDKKGDKKKPVDEEPVAKDDKPVEKSPVDKDEKPTGKDDKPDSKDKPAGKPTVPTDTDNKPLGRGMGRKPAEPEQEEWPGLKPIPKKDKPMTKWMSLQLKISLHLKMTNQLVKINQVEMLNHQVNMTSHPVLINLQVKISQWEKTTSLQVKMISQLVKISLQGSPLHLPTQMINHSVEEGVADQLSQKKNHGQDLSQYLKKINLMTKWMSLHLKISLYLKMTNQLVKINQVEMLNHQVNMTSHPVLINLQVKISQWEKTTSLQVKMISQLVKISLQGSPLHLPTQMINHSVEEGVADQLSQKKNHGQDLSQYLKKINLMTKWMSLHLKISLYLKMTNQLVKINQVEMLNH